METKNLDTIVKKIWEIPAVVEISKNEILGQNSTANDGQSANGT